MGKSILLGLNTTKYISANASKCRGCLGCRVVKNCPKQVLEKVGTFWRKRCVVVNPDSCIGCMKCVKSCRNRVFTKLLEG